jgi:hypothetical protein
MAVQVQAQCQVADRNERFTYEFADLENHTKVRHHDEDE